MTRMTQENAVWHSTKELHSYVNGNYEVTLYADGTKIRTTNDDVFLPEFPESIDIKITNMCSLGCGYCHEQSHPDGSHGLIHESLERLEGLPAGVELAIGGGNPLEHPDLTQLLNKFKESGFVCSMTVNIRHLLYSQWNIHRLASMINEGLIYGVGISVSTDTRETLNWQLFLDEHKMSPDMADNNIVAHVIAGVHSMSLIKDALKTYKKVLILGFKQFGHGVQYYDDHVEELIKETSENLHELFPLGRVSFDNLAIAQLDVKNILPREMWDKYYMGDDGEFTMYYDAVKDQFAKSSISVRHVAEKGETVVDYFKKIREQLKNKGE